MAEEQKKTHTHTHRRRERMREKRREREKGKICYVIIERKVCCRGAIGRMKESRIA